MKWYIIHTTPGYENKVRDRLMARAKDNDMLSSFGEILVPAEEVSEHAEVPGSKRGEDRDEEAGHRARCRHK